MKGWGSRIASESFAVVLLVGLLGTGCALLAPSPDSGQAPHYAASPWTTLHRDSRNSDFAPVRVRPAQQVSWSALEGAALFVGPTIAPDGTVFATSGRGEGTAHLHAFTPTGELLWESEPQWGSEGLDYGAVINAPLVDDRGRVYAADLDELWCFSGSGRVLWKAELSAHGASGHFVTPILTREGHVGGITTDGKLLAFERDTGTLVWPAFDLPGVGGPPSQKAPARMLGGGLLAPEFIQPMWDLIFGWRIEVANTPAVHPDTGRIFITAGGASPGEGVLYGIDTTPDGPRIAFEAPMGAGSGSSPALSTDGSLVFAAGGDGVMVGVDAATGAVVWRAEDVQAAASPAVGPDDAVYSFFGPEVVALDGANGDVLWRVSYDDLAEASLPPVVDLPGLPAHYKPEKFARVARIDSVLSVTLGARSGIDRSGLVWAVVDIGYELPASGVVVPHAVLLTAIDARDGRVVGTTAVPDTSGALVVADAEGRVYLSLTGISASISNTLAPSLPESLRTPWQARGGLVALVPAAGE